jgi:D-sedoheptulose 7-phosphate isomerase
MDSFDILDNFTEAENVLKKFISEKKNFENICRVGEEMTTAILKGNKIIACGNGGSMSDAMHFAEELSGRFRNSRPSIPAIAVSDPGFITCTANDYGYDSVFSRFIEGLGKEGDVVLLISTSGNSKNIIKAAEVAHQKNIFVVGLTGKDGGKLAELCDAEIRVTHFGFADRIQEIHIKIIHSLVQYIERHVFSVDNIK